MNKVVEAAAKAAFVHESGQPEQFANTVWESARDESPVRLYYLELEGAALLAALPHLTEGLTGVIGDARDRSRKERDATKVSLEEWIAAAVTTHLESLIKSP